MTDQDSLNILTLYKPIANSLWPKGTHEPHYLIECRYLGWEPEHLSQSVHTLCGQYSQGSELSPLKKVNIHSRSVKKQPKYFKWPARDLTKQTVADQDNSYFLISEFWVHQTTAAL